MNKLKKDGVLKKIGLIYIVLNCNLYSDEFLPVNCNFLFVNTVDYKNIQEAEKKREKALRDYYLKKKELEYLKLNIQREMLREKPNMKKLRDLEKRFLYLDRSMDQKIVEYKGEIEYSQLLSDYNK